MCKRKKCSSCNGHLGLAPRASKNSVDLHINFAEEINIYMLTQFVGLYSSFTIHYNSKGFETYKMHLFNICQGLKLCIMKSMAALSRRLSAGHHLTELHFSAVFGFGAFWSIFMQISNKKICFAEHLIVLIDHPRRLYSTTVYHLGHFWNSWESGTANSDG